MWHVAPRPGSGFGVERTACPATARLEDDARRRWGASCSEPPRVLAQLPPALPQPFTLVAHRGLAEHLAPDPTCQLDDRLRIGLQVQPPGWLGRTPAAPGPRDQGGA